MINTWAAIAMILCFGVVGYYTGYARGYQDALKEATKRLNDAFNQQRKQM